MAAPSPERLRGDLVRLLHRGGDIREFSLGAARILARAVPFDGVCVLTLDPATHLPTAEVVENGLPRAETVRMVEIEIGGADVNSFTALGHSGTVAASLSGTTHGRLDRSRRHRELRRPHGFGDELRAVLAGDSATWGGLTLLRTADRSPFSADDVALVASLARHLAEGLRRATLHAALGAEPVNDDASAGLLLLAPDNSVARADAAAERWLDSLGADGQVPGVVAAVARRARGIADGEPWETVARARVRTASGRWLLLRGSSLGHETAVILEPVRSHELAPLIADAYELTERERAVTQLVAQGLATAAIGERLHISPWTVQDHLKSIFEKVGVGSRGELVARVFFEHDAPRLR